MQNTGQPILAGALRESLEIAGFIQLQMFRFSNFALCATVNEQIILKVSYSLYVPLVK
ncbi:hypothetical protein [Trichormus azollae]|uniref:hypothetical protein n=1 Tax=Trichormus azollae TaxID=1164 RepID=UPI003D342957